MEIFMRARGYKPFGTNLEQDALLDRIIGRAKSGTVGVFDLDGCLFDTRIRLVCIFHEFASVKGVDTLRLQRGQILPIGI